jgi:hypothetical protein
MRTGSKEQFFHRKLEISNSVQLPPPCELLLRNEEIEILAARIPSIIIKKTIF